MTARCVNCHRDVHNGSLGPNCLDCHKPEDDEENLVVRARPVHERLPRRLVEEGAR